MTEHERRVHDKTIKAYESYDVNEGGSRGVGVPMLGQNYQAIQNKYIGKVFGAGESSSLAADVVK